MSAPSTVGRRAGTWERHFTIALFLSAALLLPLGCGGHSSGSSASSSAASDVAGTSNSETTGRDACAVTTYAPNYAGSIPLAYWPQFPLYVYFDTTSTAYTADLQSRAVTAFNGWVSTTDGQVEYTVVTNPTLADITVEFVSINDPTLVSYDADGLTFYYAGSSAAGAAADQMYSSVELYVGIDGTVDRENGTMGHEFGHALGIHGHSPVSTDIMYYKWLSTRSQTPTVRDVNTLETAYCGVFSRVEPLQRDRSARRPAPPLTDPGWKVIP